MGYKTYESILVKSNRLRLVTGEYDFIILTGSVDCIKR